MEHFECSYLIDAEGAHSIARGTVGLKFEGKSLNEDYALGDLYIDGDLADSDFHIFSSEHGFMGLFPMGNRRFRLIASNPIGKPAKDTEPSLAELQEIYDQRSHIAARFRDMSWSSWFRINSRMVRHLQAGRVFLGGDAAHIHSPAGAQGMNTGLQDMINLSWKLALVLKGEAREELLETYSADRVPVIRGVLERTEALTQAIGSESTLFRSVFNHLAPCVVSLENVQQSSTQGMSQVALNYRGSELSESDGHPGTLRAGDRLPDLPVTVLSDNQLRLAEAQTTTIFKLLDASRFTLLLSNFAGTKIDADLLTSIAEWRHVMSSLLIHSTPGDELFKQHFGASPAMVLVRPDGYLAFTGTDTSVAKLAAYCGKWLVGQHALQGKAATTQA